jgi:hypothetical protein
MMYSANPPTLDEMKQILRLLRAYERTMSPHTTAKITLMDVARAKTILMMAISVPEYSS